MRRRRWRVVAAVAVVLAAVGVYVSTHSPSGANSPASTSPSPPATAFSAFYLSIGASASLGIQPTGIPGHNSRITTDGYSDDVVDLEKLNGIALTLTHTGCPGETFTTFLSTSPTVLDHCGTTPEYQLDRDEAFLAAHKNQPGLVTVDIGFNDIHDCFEASFTDTGCVDTLVATIAKDVPIIVSDLRNAGGSHLEIVGLEYNDPFLAYYLDGPSGPTEATDTLESMLRVDQALAAAYRGAGAQIADVPQYFNTDVTTRITENNVGTIPENVQDACLYTWMCEGTPFGPDDHPNDAGYMLIAKAIVATLPKSW